MGRSWALMTAGAVLAWAAVGAIAGPVPAAAAAEPATAFVPGTGAASAVVAGIRLRSSGAAIGFGLGAVRARYAGAQGNAEAAAVDMGLFETVGKAPIACGSAPGGLLPPGSIPERLTVSSGGGPSEKHAAGAGAGGPIEILSRSGSAEPNSSAAARVGGVHLAIGGVVEAVGGTASSAADLVPDKQRSATASTELASLSLANGLVELAGLRWNAAERTGEEESAGAGFSVAAVRVAGTELPAADPAALTAALQAANAALAPTGLALHPPVEEPTRTGTSVTPLRLSISPTPALRTALAAPLAALQPVRTQLLDFFKPFGVGADCNLATALGFSYLLADLALLVMGEGGGVDLEFGGAAAGTDATAYANPFGTGVGVTPPIVPVGPKRPVRSSDAARGADVSADRHTPGARSEAPRAGQPAAAPPTPPAPSAAADAAPPTDLTVAAPAASVCRSSHPSGADCAGRQGLLAGSLALGLLVLLAAADRIRVRIARGKARS